MAGQYSTNITGYNFRMMVLYKIYVSVQKALPTYNQNCIKIFSIFYTENFVILQ